MMVSKGVRCINCDLGSCPAGSVDGRQCSGGAFFRVDRTNMGSVYYFTWLGECGGGIRPGDYRFCGTFGIMLCTG